MRIYAPKPEEKAKKIWLYCDNCGFQKASAYFNPPICPRCKVRLRFLQLTKDQYDECKDEISKLGCKEFVKRHMRRGEIIYGRDK